MTTRERCFALHLCQSNLLVYKQGNEEIKIYLESERIIIQSFRDLDTEWVTPLLKDPNIMRTTGLRSIQSDDSIKALTNKWANSQGDIYLSIFEKGTNQYVGWYMIKFLENESIEIGYMVAEKFKGRGFSTEATGMVINEIKSQFKIKSVIATTDSDNVASQRVLIKNNFSIDKKEKNTFTYKYRS